MLDFPLHEGFFPQIALTADELKQYRRLSKERLAQLVRVIEDADCAYKWTDVATPPPRRRRRRTGLHMSSSTTTATTNTPTNNNVARCQQAQFLDFQPATKRTVASTLLKASVHVADARVDDILTILAKSRTKEFRKVMTYLHTDHFVDGRTLFTFPTSSSSSSSTSAPQRPPFSYRAIKWHVMQRSNADADAPSNYHSPRAAAPTPSATANTSRPDARAVDFCYLEYAGTRRTPLRGSNVVGFCLTESIQRDREVPSLASVGVVRGSFTRAGIIISRTHQPNVVQVTAVSQLDGDLAPGMRAMLEPVLLTMLQNIARIPALLERTRVSRLRFVEQWQWIPNADRKACAVCLRGFYFHRKHHCRTCGEVVCSTCAPLRELDDPIFDISHLRVCANCMATARSPEQRARNGQLLALSDAAAAAASASSTTTSHADTTSYLQSLQKSPKHDAYEDMAGFTIQQQQQQQQQQRFGRRRRESEQKEPVQIDRSSRGRLQRSHEIESIDALTTVVQRIRAIRDTINTSVSHLNDDLDDLDDLEENDDAINSNISSSNSSDLFNDIHNAHDATTSSHPLHRIRETLESSVDRFDAALAVATTHSTRTGRFDQQQQDDDDDAVMTPEQFASVARITFAAARATQHAGEAFLSSCGGSSTDRKSDVEMDDDDDDDDGGGRGRGDAEASLSTSLSLSDALDDDDDEADNPFAATNYARVMATLQDDKRARTDDTNSNDRKSNSGDRHDVKSQTDASESSPPPRKRTKSLTPSTALTAAAAAAATRRAAEIAALEQQIEALQRSLEHAQRKLSVFGDTDDLEFEPDPEQLQQVQLDNGGGINDDDKIASVFDVFGRRERRTTDGSGGGSGVKTLAVPSPAAVATTMDLVTELRGVMNSSERTKPTGRRSFTKPPPPPPPPLAEQTTRDRRQQQREQQRERQSLPSSSVFGAGAILPSPIPHHRKSHNNAPLSLVSPTGSLESLTEASYDHRDRLRSSTNTNASSSNYNKLDNTASSSASNPQQFGGLRHSFTSSTGVLVGRSHFEGRDAADAAADTSVDESAQYRLLMGSAQFHHDDDVDATNLSDDLSSEDDDAGGAGGGSGKNKSHSADRFALMGVLDKPKLRSSSITPTKRLSDVGGHGSSELVARKQHIATVDNVASPLSLSPTSTSARRRDRRQARRDERDELRELMEGLGRPRSNSVPFRSHTGNAPNDQNDPLVTDSTVDKPVAWSDGSPNRTGTSTAHINHRLRAPQHVAQTLREVRSCVASFLVECPSQRERTKKLDAIVTVLESLVRDGNRSSFRTLDHDAIRYASVVRETPSLIRVLKLAGYVSLPHQLTMRRVDQAFIAVILRELETVLKH